MTAGGGWEGCEIGFSIFCPLQGTYALGTWWLSNMMYLQGPTAGNSVFGPFMTSSVVALGHSEFAFAFELVGCGFWFSSLCTLQGSYALDTWWLSTMMYLHGLAARSSLFGPFMTSSVVAEGHFGVCICI